MTEDQEILYRDLVLAFELAETEEERKEILCLIHTAQQIIVTP